MSKPLGDFIPFIAPFVNGCPDPLIERAVRHAAIRLCERSACWRATLPAIDTVAGQAAYAVTPPEQSKVARILWAKLEGKELEGATDDGLLATELSRPEYYYWSTAEFILSPVPSQGTTAALLIRAALKPTLDASELDAAIADEYHDGFVHGALNELLSMHEAEWANLALATSYGAMFQNEINRARRKAETGDSRITRTVAYGGF
ncbi:hypothetical protein DV711_06105 [Motiliproteus coralliicola]|uniref:Uncharacterized protein n=1 Tax=Motiliproteus coralliicola TaxID=2283196 RepID=A0A369WTY3_9GAMM|nr:hypothetical protein [Motiliproteus coralliicola]RDE25127.1 hypothetical protein DV711_06105 [Motiliproteus coralliicola]